MPVSQGSRLDRLLRLKAEVELAIRQERRRLEQLCADTPKLTTVPDEILQREAVLNRLARDPSDARVRDWLKAQGVLVPPRGRVSLENRLRYAEAHYEETSSDEVLQDPCA